MKKALCKLEIFYAENASETEKGVARFFIDHPKRAIEMNTKELAKETFASTATIIRVAQKIGFDGLKDLKVALTNDLIFSSNMVNDTLDYSDNCDISKIALDTFNKNIEAIRKTYDLLNKDDLNTIVDYIIKSNHLYLFGYGASFVVAKDAQQKFERVGKKSILYEDGHMQLIAANNIEKNEVAIIFSYSGLTKEILQIAKIIKERSGIVVAITKYGSSKLISLSDYNLYVVNVEGLLRVGASSSRITQLTIVDTIFQLYLNKTKDVSMEKVLKTNDMLSKE
ncbi:MAG: MurR/RpiR family transcriptional regulator [Anaerorhabdus sp.]